MNNKKTKADEMTAVEYFKAKARMTNNCGSGCVDCNECPLFYIRNGTTMSCGEFECKHPEEAVAIVQKWAEDQAKKEAPKTMLQDFLEKFPNADMYPEGYPKLCPYRLGYDSQKYCVVIAGKVTNCIDCWNRPMMTPERKAEFDKSVDRAVKRLLGESEKEEPKKTDKKRKLMFWRDKE